MKFEIYPSKTIGLLSIPTEWRWRLKASNGEPIASGESYKNKADCLYAISLIKTTNNATPVVEVAA